MKGAGAGSQATELRFDLWLVVLDLALCLAAVQGGLSQLEQELGLGYALWESWDRRDASVSVFWLLLSDGLVALLVKITGLPGTVRAPRRQASSWELANDGTRTGGPG